jgi:hypothetical protein
VNSKQTLILRLFTMHKGACRYFMKTTAAGFTVTDVKREAVIISFCNVECLCSSL